MARLLVFVKLDQLIVGALVGDIGTDIFRIIVKIVDGQELVKSHSFVHIRTVPAAGQIRMDGNGLIPLGLQVSGKRAGIVGHILLIRDTSDREESHGVSCQELELRVGCAAAIGGYTQVSVNHVIPRKQTVHVRVHFQIRLKITYSRKVRVGFVHDADNGRLLPVFQDTLALFLMKCFFRPILSQNFIGENGMFLLLLNVLRDHLHFFEAVVSRHLDRHILGIHGQGDDHTVIGKVRRLVPGVVLHAQFRQEIERAVPESGEMEKDRHQKNKEHRADRSQRDPHSLEHEAVAALGDDQDRKDK